MSVDNCAAKVASDNDEANALSDSKWFVAIVNPRHEKAVAERLVSIGFEAYVATQQELHIWNNGRKKMIDRVIIPSIVFIRCSEKQRREIVRFPFILRFMVNRSANTEGLKPLAVISDKEIGRLKFMLGQSDYPVEFTATNFKAKDNVRVVRGKLAGLVGVVDKVSDCHHTITIIIDHLGCAKVVIESQNLELI